MLTPFEAIRLAIQYIETTSMPNQTVLMQLEETQASLMPKPMRTAKPFNTIEISAIEWCGSSSGTAYQWVTVIVDDVLIGKAYISGHGDQYKIEAWRILEKCGYYCEAKGVTYSSGYPIDYGNLLDDIAEHKDKFSVCKHEVNRERDAKRWYVGAGEVVTLSNESEVK